MTGFKVIERPTPAVGARGVITGQARYTTDLYPAGALVAKLLYTAYPYARILRIECDRARAMPGVAAILTASDIPGPNSYDLYDTDQPLLIEVGDCARYQGDPVAVVVAESEQAALAGLEAIDVEYEPLEGTFDPVAACQPGASSIWPHRSNLYDHLHIERGDVERAFERADVVIEGDYQTQCMEQAFLEPEGAVAVPGPEGQITVHAGCQAPHRDRRQIARSLALPESKVRVVVPHVGGSFGGKDETHVQIHAALAAKLIGRPVRLIRSREESIRTHVKRHPITIRYRTAAARDGKILGITVEGFGDGGPYANMTRQVMEVFAIHASGPYFVPSARIDAYSVLTNNPTSGAMRGFGMPQSHFACEQQMDRLAEEVGLDPVEIRRINAIETGAKLATGVTALETSGMRASLDEAARMIGWQRRAQLDRRPAPHLRRGVGLAAVMQGYLLGPKVRDDAASVTLELGADGSVTARLGIVDYGQGAHTVLTQIAAEALGVRLADVRVITPDTDKTLEAGSACSSRVTFICGHAVLRAAASIRAALLATAAEITGHPLEALTLEDGYLHAGGSRLDTTVAQLGDAARRAGRQIAATGYYAAASEYPPGVFEPEVFDNPCAYYTFGAQAVQVLVDVETGEVEVERMCLALDAGRVLNPVAAVGQAEGGLLQALGYALMEELVVERGQTRNVSLESYLIPTARDAPPTEVRFIDSEGKYGPYGARGLAELPIVPGAAAIANAIRDATGVSCRQLPMTPQRLAAELEQLADRVPVAS
jgi:CO/xanthine dehydrogenase Mo-binding subunit